MILINCPYCGERDQSEFSNGGEAHVARPENSENLNDFTNLENLKHSILAAIKHTVINMIYDVRPEDANLFKVINDLAKSEKFDYDGLNFVFPIHPNPNVTQHQGLLTDVTVVPAVSHDKCIDLINRCNFVITDSGGIQEESCFLRKKCVVCREFTERVEGLEDFAMLCKNPEDLKSLFYRIKREKNSLIDHACPYGDGKATPKIVEILNAFFTDNTPE